jgi:prolyl-tRNA synthetase
MRLSKLFGKPSKTEGADYQLASHRLLTQAGFIRESTAGRYYLLPLGIKVHEKVTGIVRSRCARGRDAGTASTGTLERNQPHHNNRL